MSLPRIRVQVRKGLFPSERLIIVSDAAGATFESLVPVDFLLKTTEDSGEVAVQVLASHNGTREILLPGEATGNRNNILTVREEQLLAPA